MRIILVLSSLVIASQAQAYRNCTTQRIGNQTFTNCSDGTSENSMQIGNQQFRNGYNPRTRESWSGNTMELNGQQFRNDFGDYHRSPSLGTDSWSQPQQPQQPRIRPYRSIFD